MPDAPGECPEWVLRLRPRPAENGGAERGRGNEAEKGAAERGGPGNGAERGGPGNEAEKGAGERGAGTGGAGRGRGNEAENGTAERGGPGDGAVGDDAADNTGAMCPKYSFRVAQHLTPRGCL